MSNPDQQCGTCKWWQELAYAPGRGECNGPVPDSIMNEDRDNMAADYGTTCPCWEAKE